MHWKALQQNLELYKTLEEKQCKCCTRLFNKCNLELTAIHTFPIMPPPHLFNPYRVRMMMMDMMINKTMMINIDNEYYDEP